MTGDREENGIEADDPGTDRADDPDVEIHEAILGMERAGGCFPDADALAAMEEPLDRLASACGALRRRDDELLRYRWLTLVL